MTTRPGLITIFGSGEIAASGRTVYERLFRQFPQGIRLAILETPAGFEPNSAQVAEAVAAYFVDHLQNFRPRVTIVPARKRGTPLSPDEPEVVAPLLEADVIFLGPGSPTYATRQLRKSLAWDHLRERHRDGAFVVLASAGAGAAGAFALPVYEIYKVGADLHWRAGLDFLGEYGLKLVFIPHWNNREGGEKVDTSRCYVGKARFELLAAMLPIDARVVGIDEHTALTLDLSSGTCLVLGQGSVTLRQQGKETCYLAGQSFSVAELGPLQPETRPEGTTERPAADRPNEIATGAKVPPDDVLALVALREKARSRKDWRTADALREQILARGWKVSDLPGGPALSPLETGRSF